MTMKISQFSFSRRVILIKHLQNVFSVLEKFHLSRYIRNVWAESALDYQE